MENLQEQINVLESRQLELLAIMSSSDAHAAKCIKLGLSFQEEYPEEFAAYKAAREEYNSNEGELLNIKEQPEKMYEPLEEIQL